MDAIVERGWGALLYLRQEGRGIGLHAKIQAYHLQDAGATRWMRTSCSAILPMREITLSPLRCWLTSVLSVELMTNNPEKWLNSPNTASMWQAEAR